MQVPSRRFLMYAIFPDFALTRAETRGMPLNGHNSARSTPLVQDFLFLSLFALFLFFMYLLSFSLLTGKMS